MIEDRQSKTLLTNETVQRLRALRQRQWQKAAADFNKRQDAARARADASIAAWLAAHKERVALGMTTDGGTTTDHCDTEGMTEEVAAENQGSTIPAKTLSKEYFTYYIILRILPLGYYCF